MTLKKVFTVTLLVLIAIVAISYFKIFKSESALGTCVVLNLDDLENINFKDYKKVVVSANQIYEADIFKQFLQGENYRDAWHAKVEVPILMLDTLFGGVDVVKEGGGTQTMSLRLKSKDSLLLTLRSVNKNPSHHVPDVAKTLGLENIVYDGISGQHPYAATVVSNLAEALGILHTKPQVVFLPKQPTLGDTYNKDYGNRLFILEFENKGNSKWLNNSNSITIIDTDNLQKLKNDLPQQLQIDKDKLIRARLFDVIIGDWDRHAKQWGWVINKVNDSLLFAEPLPVDRDNAFFNVGGIVPSIIANKNVTPHLQSFENSINNMDGLVYDFDVYFLQQTRKEDFIQAAKYIQKTLKPRVIDNAFKSWNKDLRALNEEEIKNKIKARLDSIIPIAIEFKRILDKRPLLNKPLKGSSKSDTKGKLIQCFECQ